jgi:hypothetical protein
MPSKKSDGFMARWKHSTHGFAPQRVRITVLAVACIVAAGILIAARQPALQTETPALELQPQDAAVIQPAPVATPVTTAAPAPRRQARNAAAPTPRVTTTVRVNAVPAKTSEPASGSNAPAIESTPKAAIVEAAATTPRAEAASRAPAQAASAVTVTGCLERDDDKFQLKDTSGENAPRSRSWRSGFLRKGSASIDVTDAANRLRLPSHVGHRVSLTGMLVDREMQARSLQMLAANCDD